MAGAGYKLFNTGDVLTAAQVNTYLMEQTVMVFANAAARTSALTGVVSEGMISYLKDTNAVEVYDGSNWVSSDDPNAIQNTIVDAKGDLISASAADVPARLAVGSNGETLVADSSTSTGLRWQGNYVAGKNALINGGFDIWQRGTSSTTTSGYVTADRWTVFSGGAVTWARESTTVPAGSTYSMKITAGASIQPIIYQAIETLNAIQFAGKNVTLSLLAQASTNTNISFDIQYSTAVDNPSGGTWTTITASSGGSGTATTSGFTQMSGVFAIPSTAKSLFVRVYPSGNIANGVILYYGQIQLELGSVATTFSRAGGTLAGEFLACARYYQALSKFACAGYAAGNIESIMNTLPFITAMRATPTVTITSTGTTSRLSSASIQDTSTTSAILQIVANGAGFAGIYGATAATASIELQEPKCHIQKMNLE